MFHFYNTFPNLSNISSFFWWNNYFFLITSKISSYISILSSFDLVRVAKVFDITRACNFVPKNSPALWTTFLEASSPVSNNCFLYFLVNDKFSYPLTYFLVLGSAEYHRIAKLEESVISIY